ncbi:MAG: hypothetical protein A4E40_01067 [Methanoregulaceae archaeon PtaU1.Bin059]|nr:MAG: hypothetical protein A4E39_00468 [Methanoregulaceae archaeon PtaB.Bin152]OPY39563.1 MAG: hypothetical protein A4E40_01067 [Methanoregulaceae archaeon PtaU1.Bin059]
MEAGFGKVAQTVGDQPKETEFERELTQFSFLIASTFLVVFLACVLPFTFLGSLFGFVPPPLSFYAVLVGLVACYLVMVEVTKRWFYRRYSTLEEQSAGQSRSA